MESLELYHQSGTPRTIRLKAWAVASKSGQIRVDVYAGNPIINLKRASAQAQKNRGEKVFQVEVVIKVSG